MSNTGWVSPGTVVSDDAVGTVAWSNPSNAKSEDGNEATFWNEDLVNKYSEYLEATNLGFSIPSGSTINGVEVTYKVDSSYYDSAPKVEEVVLVGPSGVFDTSPKGGEWVTGATTLTYGDSTDTWGESLTVTDINSSAFGVALQGLAYADSGGSGIFVDHIQIKVYYTESTGTPTVGVKYPLPAFKRP